ncbi:hypothetical protein TNCV_1915031 [Trichonephila clavipes]|uniref:Uncharacterized protein n=1 Tax=Trichonephila clavipes TaxID=2585209 RepID=A0A8X6W089_TRICX|nr:hypothetical protein TNCV_1915031 [Trichonephila clavipes]
MWVKKWCYGPEKTYLGCTWGEQSNPADVIDQGGIDFELLLGKPYLCKENPSLKDKENNAEKKTLRITSELTSEELERTGFVVIGIVQREQLSELKEKIKWHFSSNSTRWYGGREWFAVSSKFYERALQELV